MKSFLMIGLLVSFSALANGWNRHNDPANFDSNFEYSFKDLPKSATLPLSKMPWSSSYWPRFKGSINYRWNTPNPTGLGIVSPTKAQVQSMSLEQLAKLSPAEKFDLVRGYYNYPLSSRVARNANPEAKEYEGICDGWTATAIQFAEPAAVVVANPDGIQIPFGTADVKAIMSYDVSRNFKPGSMESVFAGRYCNSELGLRLGTANCEDLNPGAFHVILANQIGLKKESFAVDIISTKETWNQPVFGFEFEVLGQTNADNSSSVIIHAKLKYAEDDPEHAEDLINIFTWEPTVGTDRYMFGVMELDYELELDNSGRIVGGKWLGASKEKHPDLFWMPTKKIVFTEDFKALYKIYKPNFIE